MAKVDLCNNCAVKGIDHVYVFPYINSECLKLSMALGSGWVTEQKPAYFIALKCLCLTHHASVVV